MQKRKSGVIAIMLTLTFFVTAALVLSGVPGRFTLPFAYTGWGLVYLNRRKMAIAMLIIEIVLLGFGLLFDDELLGALVFVCLVIGLGLVIYSLRQNSLSISEQ